MPVLYVFKGNLILHVSYSIPSLNADLVIFGGMSTQNYKFYSAFHWKWQLRSTTIIYSVAWIVLEVGKEAQKHRTYSDKKYSIVECWFSMNAVLLNAPVRSKTKKHYTVKLVQGGT
jgi:hypothetical protein